MAGKKVLIVDPSSGPHDPINRILTARNYTVVLADSATAAWESLVSQKPDMVVTETMLPGGTEGFHLIWSIREHPDRRLSRIPIIVVSDIHRTTPLDLFPDMCDGHYRASEFLPVQGFLDKPIDERVLLAKIDGLLTGNALNF